MAAEFLRARPARRSSSRGSRLTTEVLLTYLEGRRARRCRARPRDRARLPRRLPAAASGARSNAGCATGQILGVVATNALELGIDIGVARRVRDGRLSGHDRLDLAARRPRRPAHGALGARCWWPSSAPLDQYIADHPEYFFDRLARARARSTPTTCEILVQHLKCAAFELPFGDAETFGADDVAGSAALPARERPRAPLGRCRRRGRRRHWHWTSETLSGRRRQPARVTSRQLRRRRHRPTTPR